MTERKHNPIVRVLPSLTDVAFLMPLILVFLVRDGARSLLEGDTGWHIRTGEWILANGRVPDKDIFSFTKAGEPWFAWEWLSDAGFGWLHRLGGMEAVVLASVFLISLTFVLLFRLAARKCENPVIAIAVTWLAVAASAIHWWARPHLFTLFFTVLFCSLLERARKHRTAILWLLPPLTVLWTNLHAGFFVGIILIGAYAAGDLTRALLETEPEERRASFARARPLLLTGFGCFAASFANPYFYRLHIHIFNYLTDSYHVRSIMEFQSISFHHPVAWYFELMLMLAVAAAFWSLYRRRFEYAFLVLGWAHLALYAQRNIAIFVLVAAPVVAQALGEWGRRLSTSSAAGYLRRAVGVFEEASSDVGGIDRIPRFHLASVVPALLLIAVCYAPSPPAKFRAEYDETKYPAKAIESLGSTEFAGRVFANDEWGDYLIYRLFPATKVFVDGRSDFYGSEFSEKYLDIFWVRQNWEKNLNRFAVDTVLLPVSAALAAVLKESERWQSVYDDGTAILFRSTATSVASERNTSSTSHSGRSGDREITQISNKRREPS